MAKRKTHEEYQNQVKQLRGNEFEIIGLYVDNKTKIRFRHNICGHEWDVAPNSILHGSGCPECFLLRMKGYRKKNAKTLTVYKNEVRDLTGIEYEVLGEYTNTNNHILMKHNVCGHEYLVAPRHFLSGKRCPRCLGRNRSEEEFLTTFNELSKGEYLYLGGYSGVSKKVRFHHKPCGNIFSMSPSHFVLDNQRCPKCATSKGEMRVEEWLIRNNITYSKQYKFADCINKLPLKFDFAIFINERLYCLIEFDGKQHYKAVKTFGGITKLEYTKKNDEIKNNYCLINIIKLIRIPYWDINEIESILSSSLSGILNRDCG